MVAELVKGEYRCLICHDTVDYQARVWSCNGCYTVFHLSCVDHWALASEEKEAEAQERQPRRLQDVHKIRCPICKAVDTGFAVNLYRCYCRQTVDPSPTGSYPHSCGNVCGRSRGVNCPHPCTAPCHPGPCDPCRLPGADTTCACGKMPYKLRCGEVEVDPKTCPQTCDKLLDCGAHHCEQDCHRGSCGSCPLKETQKCFCGKHEEERNCSSGVQSAGDGPRQFACGEHCNKALSCGNHRCTFLCHAGSCSGCPRAVAVPTRCACGKTETDVMRTSCSDPLPVCGKKCDRMLSCRRHMCTRKCHDSPCTGCTMPVKRTCRCGLQKRTIKCSEYERRRAEAAQSMPDAEPDDWIRCRKKCNKILSCGVHKCGVVCCKGKKLSGYPEHRCRQRCGKKLACGRHVCEEFCHRGPCAACPITFRRGLSCGCGAEHIPGPVQCGSVAGPRCRRPCTVVLNCGHRCSKLCHHGTCPPCTVTVSKECRTHGSAVHNVPCYVENVSCGSRCARLLACGAHPCPRSCHADECVSVEKQEQQRTKGCSQACGGELSCGHSCQQRCHPGSVCRSETCRVKMVIKCVCGARCSQEACRGRQKKDVRAIPCDERCKIEARNQNFRAAFGIGEGAQSGASSERIPFSSSVLEHCLNLYGRGELEKALSFVEELEDVLHLLVERGPKAVKQKHRSVTVSGLGEARALRLPKMTSDERFVVLSLLPDYQLVGETDQQSRHRGRASVRVQQTDAAMVPSFLLSRALSEYAANPEEVKTLESCPPECMIVVDDVRTVSSSLVQDRLRAWAGDYRMWRTADQLVLLFTNEKLRNSAFTVMSKHGGRKATKADSLAVGAKRKAGEHKRPRRGR